ncbi:replication-relaxation family protein [Kribbella monticola]|uniref:replication-relaxation family protein n=1 Tax=Kribbella monticola TaxID=2185285 RepID=UPI00130037D6|nr:replication-relaxation family protein [Kribbella monticola]
MTSVRGEASRILRLQSSLGQRELAILCSLNRLRLLTTNHVVRLHFTDLSPKTQDRRARAVLRRMVDLSVIARLPREVGGIRAGSTTTRHVLTGLGQAVVDLCTGRQRRRRTTWQTTPYFQEHILTASELYVRVREEVRVRQLELVRFEGEPECWRPFTGPAGQLITLKPDAFVEVGNAEYELVTFVEVDLGTESLPTVQRKCQVYLDYWHNGHEQQSRGVFPRVLWLVPDQHRAENLRKAIHRLGKEADRLFEVGTHDDGPLLLTTLPGSQIGAAA